MEVQLLKFDNFTVSSMYHQQCEGVGPKHHIEADYHNVPLQGRAEDCGGRLRLQRLQGRKGNLHSQRQTLKLCSHSCAPSVCVCLAKISSMFMI